MKAEINPDKIYTIAKKEFMDNVRNKWVIALTIIFVLLTLLMSYFGGAMTPDGVGFQGFKSTVAGISTITATLLPIIAIMLGYGAIIGEKENGSLGVVLSCPVSRFDLIIGKFVGLGGVLFTTIFIGFGLAGVVVAAMSTAEDGLAYIAFMFVSFIFTMIFLGFAILLSTLVQKRSTAMAGGVLLWFSGMILGMVLFGIWVATSDYGFHELIMGLSQGTITIPDWFWMAEFLNFMDLYPIASMLLFGVAEIAGQRIGDFPNFVNVWTTVGWMFFVAMASFLLSLFIMRKKDI